ncbi:MAG: TIGR04076 family protein [Bacteroides sp.]|nr:TIGR04076 family protein [Bacteroides sp.]
MDRRKFLGTAGMATVATVLGVDSAWAANEAHDKEESKNKQQSLKKEENDMTTKKHKCRITVLKRECYQDLQQQYLADPKSGPCPYFHEGQEIMVDSDNFFHMLDGKFCSEAWDCISRYVYAALQGGSIMRGWTNDEKMMITCCNDGTRPVVFKLERVDE